MRVAAASNAATHFSTLKKELATNNVETSQRRYAWFFAIFFVMAYAAKTLYATGAPRDDGSAVQSTDSAFLGAKAFLRDVTTSSSSSEDDDGQDSTAQTNDDSPSQRVCLVANNARTASLFTSGTLRDRGSGLFDFYVVDNTQIPYCRKNDLPIVRMMFQKELTKQKTFRGREMIIVQGDENCRCPTEFCGASSKTVNDDNEDDEGVSRIVARQYYSKAYREAIPYLPLGSRYEFERVSPHQIPQASERRRLLNVIVSPTSKVRTTLVDSLSDGTKMKKSLENLNEGSLFVWKTPGFTKNATHARGFVAPQKYREILLDSKFTLCPAGHNPEAFRVFEAAEAGSIPVLVTGDDEYLDHACVDAFKPLLDSGAPFLVLKDWKSLDVEMKKFLESSSIDERQHDLALWLDSYWIRVAKDLECSISNFVSRNDVDLKLRDDCDEDDSSKTTTHESTTTPSSSSSSTTTANVEKPRSQKGKKQIPLVTGCGRSGSLSVSSYLASKGISSIHEGMKRSSVSVSWLYLMSQPGRYPFEDLASAKLRVAKRRVWGGDIPIFDPVVHLVRHPLKVISSTRRCFCGKGTRDTMRGRNSDAKSWKFVDAHLGTTKGLAYDSLKRSMLYWYGWNQKAVEISSETFRLEDLNPRELVRALRIESSKNLGDKIPADPAHVSKKSNSKYKDVGWKDLAKEDEDLARDIFNLAKSFGYEHDTEFEVAVRGGP